MTDQPQGVAQRVIKDLGHNRNRFDPNANPQGILDERCAWQAWDNQISGAFRMHEELSHEARAILREHPSQGESNLSWADIVERAALETAFERLGLDLEDNDE